MNNDNTIVDLDETWTIQLTGKTLPKYGIAYKVSNWLKNNLETLTDDDNNPVFNKVNLGFDENNLKSFGVKPVCDVHINDFTYDPNFDYSMPNTVNSIILFYSKGTSDKSYLNACRVHDYILQEFLTNDDFKTLESTVRDTHISNSRLMIQPIRKRWGVMGAFELSHLLF